MSIHFQKIAKKVMAVAFASICAVASLCSFTGCKSNWPKATMKIEFNDKTYTLTYKLYRRFFPRTVQHFIELADGGFYDGLCFHDYQSDQGMFTGGYTYSEADASDITYRGLTAVDYYEYIKNIPLTQTVFRPVVLDENFDESKLVGTGTLYGEFSANGYTILNNDKRYGAKKEGALVMYYNDKSDYDKSANDAVVVKRLSANKDGAVKWYSESGYNYNSATSLFYMSFNSASSVEKECTVFAELYNEDAEDEYSKLRSAIRKYIEDECEGETGDFTEETASIRVDNESGAYNNNWVVKAQYKVPVKPITLKSVKINRY